MEYLQLKYFYESAKNESFAKTAQIYMVPATSVSASVHRLEKELGCLLFERHANRIFLNKNGLRLKNALSAAFKEIDSAVADISACDDGREVRILVRAIRRDITNYIIEYNEEHPKTSFKTVFDFSDTDYDKYDVIIDREHALGENSNYLSFKICTIDLRLKASKRCTAYLKKSRLSELSDAPFVSWGESSNMHNILLGACRKAGFVPNIVAVANDKECYDRLIQAGVGIGLSREDSENMPSSVAYLDLCDLDEKYTVCCYYKEGNCSGSVKGFVEFLKAHAR